MSATTACPPNDLRHGVDRPSCTQGGPVEWVLKRNCSLAPRQVLGVYASLAGLSLGIAVCFHALGATLIVPFAGLELIALGAALFCYARHATDRERIALVEGRLLVEHHHGGHVDRVEFQPEWVRIEPCTHDRSLIEFSARGQRMAVGRYVRSECRRALADEFRSALRQAGPPVAKTI